MKQKKGLKMKARVKLVKQADIPRRLVGVLNATNVALVNIPQLLGLMKLVIVKTVWQENIPRRLEQLKLVIVQIVLQENI